MNASAVHSGLRTEEFAAAPVLIRKSKLTLAQVEFRILLESHTMPKQADVQGEACRNISD
jgi:hypothetical protein